MTVEHNDTTTSELLGAALELLEQTPQMRLSSVETLEAHFILIAEAAYASQDEGLIQTVDTIWEIVQALKTVNTHEAIAMQSIAIVIRTLKIQRDEYRQIAAQAINRAKQLSSLTGGE